MDRLPRLPVSTDCGYVYVVRHKGNSSAYKIGFSRHNVARRVRDADGELIIIIPTGQRPAQLEYIINNRFASKRLPDTELWGREWFNLDAEDLDWLRGFAAFQERDSLTLTV